MGFVPEVVSSWNPDSRNQADVGIGLHHDLRAQGKNKLERLGNEWHGMSPMWESNVAVLLGVVRRNARLNAEGERVQLHSLRFDSMVGRNCRTGRGQWIVRR